MSQADNTYDPFEMAAIKIKMHELFPAGMDIEKKLYRTIREYNSFDKTKLKDLFEETFTHFKLHTPLKNKVYADLYEIIQADGKVVPAEARALETLKRLIDLHAEKNVT